MERDFWNKLNSKWEKLGEVYSDCGSPQSHVLDKCLHEFVGLVVVDLGCAEGRLTYDLAQHARGWIGVEHREYRHKQALITKKYIKTPGKFLCCEIADFGKRSDVYYDAILASNVLYHLSGKTIKAIRERMLPKCKVVIVVSKENIKVKMNELYSHVHIEKLLRSSGFDVSKVDVDHNNIAVIGKRK